MLDPDFTTRVRLYLKPKKASILLQTVLLLLDTLMAQAYIACQIYFVVFHTFKQDEDKVIQVLVAFGFTGAILIYVIGDASRFLTSWFDRILYIISCLLMKPILLPILLPGNFFTSYVATSQFDGRERVIVDGIE